MEVEFTTSRQFMQTAPLLEQELLAKSNDTAIIYSSDIILCGFFSFQDWKNLKGQRFAIVKSVQQLSLIHI